MKSKVLLASLALAPVLAHVAGAQNRLRKFTGDDAYDHAGCAVAIEGNTAVVGAERAHGTFASGDGAAYVLRRVGGAWPFTVGDPNCIEIFPPASVYNETFGTSVALSGATIAVGEPEYQHDLVIYDYGAVHVFHDDGVAVTLEATLIPAVLHEGLAGSSVDVSGDVVAIGAPGVFGSTTDPGHVYLYRRAASAPHWGAVEATLVAPSGAAGQRFGYAVSVDGNTCIVGEPGASVAHAFRHVPAGWMYDGALNPLIATSGLGSAVDVDGDSAIVSASTADVAVIFRRVGPANWQQVARFEGVDPSSIEAFGSSVAIQADRAVVGAANSDCAYVFRRQGPGSWIASQRLDEPYSDLGSSVAIDGSDVLVGGMFDDDAGSDAGAAMFFESPPWVDHLGFGEIGACPCSNDDTLAGCENSTGRGAQLYAEGNNLLGANGLVLHTQRLPANRSCLTFMGDGSAIAPLGAGLRVVRPGVEGMARLLPSRLSSAAGEFLDGPGMRATYAPFAALVSAGEAWFFQTWYRDPTFAGCAANTNFSNAVRVTFLP